MTLSTYARDGIADHLFNGASLAVPTVWYVQCHTGSPGLAGTSNISTAFSPARVQVTSGWSASSGGAVANSSAVLFTPSLAAETISHVSVWDHATAGNCLGYGSLAVSKTIAIGDSLNFAIDEIDITFT